MDPKSHQKLTLEELVRAVATTLAVRTGTREDEAQSIALTAIWEATDLPAGVIRFIKLMVRRGLDRDHQREKRHSKRYPKFDDIFPVNGNHRLNSYETADMNGNPPEVEAAVRELHARLRSLPEDHLEARAMNSMLGRTAAPLTKGQLAIETTGSPGNAYRRLAKLDRRIKDEVSRHLSFD